MSSPQQAFAGDSALESWRPFLLDATREVFSVMVGMELVVPDHVESETDGGITGMVGLAGAICGVLTIRSNQSFAAETASRMLGLSLEEAALQGSDAMGEICNMIAGSFKAKIGLEDTCMLSVPTVITGDSYSTHSLIVGNRLEAQLLFQDQPLTITLETRG